MKKIVYALITFFATNNATCQELIPYGEYSNSGYVDSLVWQQLNDWERKAYLETLSEFNIEPENVIWVSAQTQRNILKDNNFYNAQCITKFSNGSADGFVEEKGRNNLEQPECIVFIYRVDGLSTVKLVKYF